MESLERYAYALPDELIARRPPAARDGGRLLVVGPPQRHLRVVDLPDLLRPGDLLVVNDTRVLHARLRARRATGGAVEALLLETGEGQEVRALLRPSRKLRVGECLAVGEAGAIELAERLDGGTWRLRAHPSPAHLMDAVGEVPLPPYLRREADEQDAERYQTVFARSPGAVAAPTAGLHLSPSLLAALESRGVGIASLTLHVGPGTFRPLNEASLAGDRLHREWFSIPAATCEAIAARRARGGGGGGGDPPPRRPGPPPTPEGRDRVPCPGSSVTDLFIRRGHSFRCIDALLTNFHLPRSSLLVLVSAFAGRERVLRAYADAVAERYRFYSYGDAMLLDPGDRS